MQNEDYLALQIENILRNFITINSILVTLTFGVAIYLSDKKTMFPSDYNYYLAILYFAFSMAFFLGSLFLCLKVSVKICKTPIEKKELYERWRRAISFNLMWGVLFSFLALYGIVYGFLLQLGQPLTDIILILTVFICTGIMCYVLTKLR